MQTKLMPIVRRLSYWARLFALLCIVVTSVAGCGGGGGSADTRQTVEQVAGPFRITASVPKRTYRRGEAVSIELTVTNQSSERLMLVIETDGSNMSGLNYGEKLGQFTILRNSELVFDSLPFFGVEKPDVVLNAGGSESEALRWTQIDGRAFLPWTTESYRRVASNSAPTGNYTIVPRLSVRYYYNYETEVPTNPQLLSDDVGVRLPPLNITVVP